MAVDKLVIHKLTFNLELNDKDDFKHFADRVSSLCRHSLPTRLNDELKKHNLPDGRLIINKLDIDLGRINPHQLESLIINRITDAIGSYLSQHRSEIQLEVQQAKFKHSPGRKITIKKDDFVFESEIYLEKSVDIAEELEIQKVKKLAPTVDLNEQIQSSTKQKNEEIIQQIHRSIKKSDEKLKVDSKASKTKDSNDIRNEKVVEIPLAQKAEKVKQSKSQAPEVQTDLIKPTQESIVKEAEDYIPPIEEMAPKVLTELDKAFLYYLKYGRLPSNVRYELGTSMLDVFNISQSDPRFFRDVVRHINDDQSAKDRLIRLVDDKNKTKLIKNNILKKIETDGFDPKVPKSFEDYLAALVHGLDTDFFSAGMKRYGINDMINFIYADSPNKLKSLIRFLMNDFPSNKNLNQKIDDLFNQISKPSAVKLIASFLRKGAYLNKSLNDLNKKAGLDNKAAHRSTFSALISNQSVLDQLRKDGFDPNDLEIKARIYLKEAPNYKLEDFDTDRIVDYYLINGSLPYTGNSGINNLNRLNVYIETLGPELLKNLSFFKNKKPFRYQSLGKLSDRALKHLVKSLDPKGASEIDTRYNFFKHNIESGVPLEFQKAFTVYYAQKSNRKSYLEEMIHFWRDQFGDADKVIRNRWKVKDELDKELGMLLYVKDESLEQQLSVDTEFQSYSKDISVKNAGLVILWPFLKIYFNLLELLNPQGNFRSMEERARACLLLQYLAVKQSFGEEFYFPLNKILTGYPLEEPLPYEIKMTQREIDVSNSLLKNVIKQWNGLKGSSVDGLRGSFLIRNGVLAPSPNGWLLTVEKKAYDIIMSSMPWGIGMIKLSWAPYVLNVEWERNIM